MSVPTRLTLKDGARTLPSASRCRSVISDDSVAISSSSARISPAASVPSSVATISIGWVMRAR